MANSIKRVFFACMFISIGLVSNTFAQGFGNPEQRAERAKAQIEEILGKLELEDEKTDKVRGILTVQTEEQMSIIEGYSGQRDRTARTMMRQEMQDLQAMTNEKLSEVLSEDQMKSYKEIVAEIQERRRAQFGGRRGGGRQN